MQALREAEHTNLKLPEAKRRSRAAFGRSRVLECSATGTMPSGRRRRFFASGSRTEPRFGEHRHRHTAQCAISRFFASGSRTAWPLLRREERSRT
ncbi:unnamed protein product [Coccothraustes coccothraustes]